MESESSSEYGKRAPSSIVEKACRGLRPGKALDIACGEGRNSLYLAEMGFKVDAVDRCTKSLDIAKQEALTRGLLINFMEADLALEGLPGSDYDLIININYLERRLAPSMVKALRSGGILVFETFTVNQKAFGPPHNEAYLLREGELKNLFRELDILHYFEGVVKKGESQKAIAGLIGRKT